jgi:hypothetical protein
MISVECPNRLYPTVFLAGGITGCPDWQEEISGFLKEVPVVLLNPRRKNFPINDKNASNEQIRWEFKHLRYADAILFYFPCETLCPIALYELGAWSMINKPIFIGVHNKYARKTDIEIQTSLVRPGMSICYSLSDLAHEVRSFAINHEKNRV